MINCDTARGRINAVGSLKGKVSIGISQPVYTGPYTVTPNQQTQILQTANKSMNQNVVVNPIPSNYGLITYNGFEITVS